jgi:hypothetical protein
VGEAAEAGMGVFAGAVPAVPGPAPAAAGPGRPGRINAGRINTGRINTGRINPADGSDEARESAERVIRLWRHLGLSLETLPDQAVITPACGLAGATPAQARAALTRCREAASMLAELIEETGGES